MLEVNLLYFLHVLESLLEVLLLGMHIADHRKDLGVAEVVSAEHFDVHLERLFEQTEGIFEVASLHVALAEQGEDLGVELLGLLVVLEERAVELEGGGQVVQSLLVEPVSQVRLA